MIRTSVVFSLMVVLVLAGGSYMPAAADVVSVYQGATIPTELGGGTAAVEDMYIRANGGHNQQIRNYGGSTILGCGYSRETDPGSYGESSASRSFIRFDLSFLAGKYTSIDSAVLKLTHDTLSNGSISPVSSYGVIDVMKMIASKDWVAGNGTADGAATDESAWNYKSNPTAWDGGAGTSGGVEYNTAAGNYVGMDIYHGDGNGVQRSVALNTAWLDEWITGENGGVALRNRSEASGYNWGFRSSDHETASFRPVLEITYTPIPEPATLVLMGIGMACAARRRR